MKNGYLNLIIGPMFSGKTTYLIDIYNKNLDKKILTINYAFDKRYSENMLSSHDKKEIPCIFCESLYQVNEDEIERSDIILINEGQFFSDIYEKVQHWVDNLKKNIHIAALDGDFKRKPFGNFLDLICISDKVTKLYANCSMCKINNALFSHRISNEKEKIVIGGNNKYIPLCRNCYLIKNN